MEGGTDRLFLVMTTAIDMTPVSRVQESGWGPGHIGGSGGLASNMSVSHVETTSLSSLSLSLLVIPLSGLHPLSASSASVSTALECPPQQKVAVSVVSARRELQGSSKARHRQHLDLHALHGTLLPLGRCCCCCFGPSHLHLVRPEPAPPTTTLHLHHLHHATSAKCARPTTLPLRSCPRHNTARRLEPSHSHVRA